MLRKNNSFTSFRNILKTTVSTLKVESIPENALNNQLMLESFIKEDSRDLGLSYQNSKIINKPIKGVQSSIDSTNKKQQSNSSIPISQLIHRDIGYDYLFSTNYEKLQKKIHKNYKQQKVQLQQMIDLTLLSIYSHEEKELRSKIIEIEQEILKLRLSKPKSKSPLQQNSEYCYFSKKRKERLTGRHLKAYMKENQSHMKTQCDSKIPTLQSMPVTPVSYNKLMLSPSKHNNHEYYNILQKKKNIIKDSIETLNLYNKSMAFQLHEQCNIIRQQLFYVTSKVYKSTQKKGICYSNGNRFKEYDRSSSSTKQRRVIGFYSPRTARDLSKKSQMLKVISVARNGARLNPRQEYLLSH